jgi:heme/copper-type cytochrome/quinol oxidase subunit 2
MKAKGFITKPGFILAVVSLLMICASQAFGQCAMCKAAVEHAANGEALIRRLNLGILVMVVPPVAIFCSVFGIAYRYRNADDEVEQD